MFSVVRLAEKFAPELDQESLKEEFEDVQLMEDDVIAMETDSQPRRHHHGDGRSAPLSRRYLGRRPEPEDCHWRRQVDCMDG